MPDIEFETVTPEELEMLGDMIVECSKLDARKQGIIDFTTGLLAKRYNLKNQDSIDHITGAINRAVPQDLKVAK